MSDLCPVAVSQALYQSLLHAALLVDDLPEAPALCRSSLKMPPNGMRLRFDQKLGHLYEDALSDVFEASERVDILAKSLQIHNEAKQTLGEFDFLIYDKDACQTIHLELATKFYLAVRKGSHVSYPGPDARDNWDNKLQHLRTHQLTLAAHPEATVALRTFTPSQLCEIRQLIYGCIFDHISSETLSQPDYVSPHCRRGRWLYVHECADRLPPHAELRIIPKPLWPVPLSGMKDLLPAPETVAKIQAKAAERCVMVSIDDDETPYFIAPSSFP